MTYTWVKTIRGKVVDARDVEADSRKEAVKGYPGYEPISVNWQLMDAHKAASKYGWILAKEN